MIEPKNNIDSWQKASIIGSVWGAFEIVAGSILHNLAVPLAAGTILSALGVVIMISGARVFGGKGIFWRSALVCAALKTVSPSPVILSPMIGIALEGLLMEAGVLILGQNLIGYMLGGGLAVLSILGFKLVRLIMIYGADVVTAYKSVFDIVVSNEFFSGKGFLLPIAILVVLYISIGAFAAYSGYFGGNAIKIRFDQLNIKILPAGNSYKPPMAEGYKGGIGFLIFHIIWLVFFIVVKGFVPSVYWLSGGIVFLALSFFRYGRIRKLMTKPTFWIVITIVSVTSSIFILFGKYGTFVFNLEFWEYSFTILIRASVVIVGFACINIELKSKGVTHRFQNNMFSPLARSYSHAHSALPSLLLTFREGRNKIFRPLPLIEKMFTHFTSHASNTLDNKLLIVTAEKQGGKTSFMKDMVKHFEIMNTPIAGFVSEGLWDSNGQRSGFDLLDLQSKKVFALCDRHSKQWLPFGAYYFNPKSIEIGNDLLINAPKGAVVFIDEIGLFELEDSIWANAFEKILTRNSNPLVVSIRNVFLEQAMEKWGLHGATIVDATSNNPKIIANKLIS